VERKGKSDEEEDNDEEEDEEREEEELEENDEDEDDEDEDNDEDEAVSLLELKERNSSSCKPKSVESVKNVDSLDDEAASVKSYKNPREGKGTVSSCDPDCVVPTNEGPGHPNTTITYSHSAF
jgi:hypothetical protein